MRELCEVSWQQDEQIEEGNTVYVKEKYWLLHFGLRYEIINNIGVSYTIAICEHCKTGQLEMFSPDQLRILGTEIKK